MNTREIIDTLVSKDFDRTRTKINQTLNEKAIEAMKVRKVELGSSYFTKVE